MNTDWITPDWIEHLLFVIFGVFLLVYRLDKIFRPTIEEIKTAVESIQTTVETMEARVDNIETNCIKAVGTLEEAFPSRPPPL